jgi:hypothetical protein
MHRYEKMMAGATDMEELLAEIHTWLLAGGGSPFASRKELLFTKDITDKIEAQLKRTGRLK